MGETEGPVTSRREQKRIAHRGAEALRSKAGWDPRTWTAPDPAERSRLLFQDARTGTAYEAAAACDACAKAREASGDPEALCERHLSEAMGL
jgi:hypothetical protein